MKILHTADWHYRDKDHDEIEKNVDFLIARAQEEKPDLILISGDITDSQNLKLDSRSAKTIFRQVSELADIAPVAIVIGTPSHDGRSAEILRYVRGTHPVHVSEYPEQITLDSFGTFGPADPIYGPSVMDKIIITQIPTVTKQFLQSGSSIEDSDREAGQMLSNLLGSFGVVAQKYRDAGCPHIVSGHFQVGGAFISETQQLIGRDIEVSTDQLLMANADLICLGHIHRSQRMGREIYYSGSIYRQDFGEADKKGFYIHNMQSDPDGDISAYKSEFVVVPARNLLKIENDFTKEGEDIRELDAIMYTYGSEIEGSIIKVELKVWQDEAGHLNKIDIENFFLSAGAERVIVNIIRIPRETVRATRVLISETLKEKIEAMAELRGETVSDSILAKCEALSSTNPEELIQKVIRRTASWN